MNRALMIVVAVIVVALSTARAADPPSVGDWRDKIHPQVLASPDESAVEYIVVLADQVRPAPPASLRSKTDRAHWVVERLRSHAERSQQPVIRILENRQVEHRAFWIANLIWVRSDSATLRRIARHPSVLRVDANPVIALEKPETANFAGESRAATGIEWGVSAIRADAVWDLGYTGRGVVVGGQDTGFEWDHPAVIAQYRGYDAAGTTHDYHWHDSIHSGGSACGSDLTVPCDDTGHGTHTLGTMIGDDGGSNRIGVAPGAQWIGCRNMNEGDGTPASYTECFQWFVAPTDRDGNNPDPSMAPAVINNSWVCPAIEGCSEETLRTIVENTRAAGIVVVASAGNSGPACGTIGTAPAHYDAAFSVGATSSTDLIASFSARGPVTADGSNRLKPDLVAPGVSVRSSVPGDTYGFKSGTSMASPHVVGVTALLLSARPDLAGRVEEIEGILRAATVPLTTNDACGGDAASQIPNNTYGHGRIDALDLLTGDPDADGADNLVDCSPLDGNVWLPPTPARGMQLALGGVMTWQAPLEPGAAAVRYDVLRSTSSSSFASATCVDADLNEPQSEDPSSPATAFYYLVRVHNDCGTAAPVSAPVCTLN